MSKTLCKGIRKDGSPCQGNGLDQFDGLCIAHGPAPDQAHQWRSLGGKNSATAARLDKRIPERLKNMMDLLDDGMKRVLDGTITPAAYTAICRGVKVRIDLDRRADEEMDLIRSEETQTAAAEIAGASANLDILTAADAIVAQQDQYRIESLVDRGLASLEASLIPDQPPAAVLTHQGRHRFGYQDSEDSYQEQIDELKSAAQNYAYEHAKLPQLLKEVNETGEAIEQSLASLSQQPPLPHDPLTGEPFAELPARVKHSTVFDDHVTSDELSPEVLQDQLRQIQELTREVEELQQDKIYDQRRSLVHPSKGRSSARFLSTH